MKCLLCTIIELFVLRRMISLLEEKNKSTKSKNTTRKSQKCSVLMYTYCKYYVICDINFQLCTWPEVSIINSVDFCQYSWLTVDSLAKITREGLHPTEDEVRAIRDVPSPVKVCIEVIPSVSSTRHALLQKKKAVVLESRTSAGLWESLHVWCTASSLWSG